MYDVCLYSSVLISVLTHFPGSLRLGFVECELFKATLHVKSSLCSVIP